MCHTATGEALFFVGTDEGVQTLVAEKRRAMDKKLVTLLTWALKRGRHCHCRLAHQAGGIQCHYCGLVDLCAKTGGRGGALVAD